MKKSLRIRPDFRLVALFAIVLPLFFGRPTIAQTPIGGEEITPATTIEPESSQPFTETWAQMEARSNREADEIRKGLRKPKKLRVVANGFEEILDEQLEREWHMDRPGPPDKTKYAPTPFKSRSLGPLKSGGPSAPQSSTFAFTGPSLHDLSVAFGTGSIPPDTQGAVGPNHVLVSCNAIMGIYNKSTGARIGAYIDPDVFFTVGGVAPVNGSFDPRVLYDKQSDRWFLTSGLSQR